MAKTSSPTLTAAEWRAVERIAAALEELFGDRMRAIWLYGSRARGETPHDESDVDVMVIVEGVDMRPSPELWAVLEEAGEAAGVSPFFLDVSLRTPEWIAGRREIESFFMQEVDRDKVVLRGEP